MLLIFELYLLTFSINSLKIIFKWSLPLTSGRFRWLLKGINLPFATPVLILIENTFTTFKYSSFSRGYHVYKDVWISIIVDDSLTCEREEHNEKESRCNYMNDWVLKKIVGHVPLNWNKVSSKFLQFTNHHIRVEVTGKRVNPLCWIRTRNTSKLFFMEMQELWTWVKNSLEKLSNEFHVKVKKCVK